MNTVGISCWIKVTDCSLVFKHQSLDIIFKSLVKKKKIQSVSLFILGMWYANNAVLVSMYCRWCLDSYAQSFITYDRQ